jgi:hypothetical protein
LSDIAKPASLQLFFGKSSQMAPLQTVISGGVMASAACTEQRPIPRGTAQAANQLPAPAGCFLFLVFIRFSRLFHKLPRPHARDGARHGGLFGSVRSCMPWTRALTEQSIGTSRAVFRSDRGFDLWGESPRGNEQSLRCDGLVFSQTVKMRSILCLGRSWCTMRRLARESRLLG